MKKAVVTTLIENLVYSAKLVSEHGLSILVETDSSKILFDTGQSANFIRNAEIMNIDLKEIDICVISHGHYDHSGGLPAFMEINSKADIWLGRGSFVPKFDRENRYIGMPPGAYRESERIKFSDRVVEIADNCFILPEAPIHYKEDTHINNMLLSVDRNLFQDHFSDEQSLVVVKDGSLNIISSCSHRGISNIVKFAIDTFGMPVKQVIGGFHLKNDNPEKTDKLIDTLNILKVDEMRVCHCTGIEKYCRIKQKFDGSAFYNHTGISIEL